MIASEQLLRDAFSTSERVPCTRGDGFNCRIHYDSDLCPACATSLAIDRAYRAMTGRWIGAPAPESLA